MTEQEEYNLIRTTMPMWHYWFNKPFKLFLEDGVTREMSFCLVMLYLEKEQLSMSSLAQRARVSKQQMTKIIDKLIEFNFVERISDENDRRIILIKITQTGIDYLDKHNQRETAYYDEVLGLMEEEDRKSFLSSLSEIHRILGSMPHPNIK